ncbi:MAG: HD domain-containing protein [Clostridia bacterium]|nr:HD domain-containing protein [Clostridia bacterium]
MSRMRLLNTLPEGTLRFEGFCIVKSADVRQNKNGTDYLDLVLTDCEGEGIAKLWDYSRELHGTYTPGDVIKVRGTINMFRDAEQLKIEKIRPAAEEDEVDMSLLLPCAPIDPEAVYDELYRLAEDFRNEDLRRLVTYLMRQHKEQLLIHPAAVKLHHATRGGLLHHTSTIISMAKGIAKNYPALNLDLICAGAILHDIGKLREIEASALGIPSGYSTEGNLLGHITMGVNEIVQAADLLEIDPEITMLLQHMLLSHHGAPEFGSPKYPMFPEAEVLSELDLLDSRLYEMYAALEGIQPRGFTERQWALDNRQLFKHSFGC